MQIAAVASSAIGPVTSAVVCLFIGFATATPQF